MRPTRFHNSTKNRNFIGLADCAEEISAILVEPVWLVYSEVPGICGSSVKGLVAMPNQNFVHTEPLSADSAHALIQRIPSIPASMSG